MTISIELQIATEVKTLPHPAQIKEWISRALFGHVLDTAEFTIRIVDKEESEQLNQAFRHKKGPTNVLSFPYADFDTQSLPHDELVTVDTDDIDEMPDTCHSYHPTERVPVRLYKGAHNDDSYDLPPRPLVSNTQSPHLVKVYDSSTDTQADSFEDDEFEYDLMGDIVICAPIVEWEAEHYHKPLLAHWAHMIIHGTLHILGYDHIEDEEAEQMESLETQILVDLGFAPPYGDTFKFSDEPII